MAHCAYGQQPEGFARLPVPGIEELRVNVFATDAEGALWIGTDRGLLRFDGAQVETHQSDPADPSTLQSDRVLRLMSLGDDALLAGTAGGVYRIDPKTGRGRQLLFEATDGSHRHTEARSFARSSRGHYAFCGWGGIFHMAKGDTVYRKVALPDTLGRPLALGGWEAPDGSLWYVDGRSIVHWAPALGAVRRFRYAEPGVEARWGTLLLEMHPDRFQPGIIWHTSWGLGLVRFDTRTGSFTSFVSRPERSDLWNIVRNALQVDEHRWLLEMDDRLHELDTRTGELRKLSDKPIMAVGHGTGGDVLAGGIGEVFVRTPALAGWRTFGPGLRSSNVNITAARDGQGYWAARYYNNQMLFRIDSQGIAVDSVAFRGQERGLQPFHVLHGADDALWVGSTAGVYHWKPAAKSVEWVQLQGDERMNGAPGIVHMIEDTHGRILAVSSSYSVHWIDARTGAQGIWKTPLTDGGTLTMLDLLDGEHAIAHRDGGAPWVFPLDGSVPFELPVDAGEREFTGSHGLVVANDSMIIMFYGSIGLKRLTLQRATGRWRIDRRWQPRSRPWIGDGQRDHLGRVWFSSDRGALVLDPVGGGLHLLDPLHGMPLLLNNIVEAVPGGGMVLCGEEPVRFLPGFTLPRAQASLVFRSVTAGAEDLTAQARSGMITLPYRNDGLSLRFSVISLRDGPMVEFAYRHEQNGEQGSWRSIGTDRALTMLRLGPGTHMVEVRADSPDGQQWTERLYIAVLPPWWQRWWAVAAGALAALALIAVVIKWRERELKRRNRLLEEKVKARTAEVLRQGEQIARQKDRIEQLLLNILPRRISEELQEKGQAEARFHAEVTVLFTDMSGFTQAAERLSPQELVRDLHECFALMDGIVERWGLEKIKTIGDAYMCACGVPEADPLHAVRAVHAALEIRDAMAAWEVQQAAHGRPAWRLRIGLHSGPVVAGVVGHKKFAYDIWGDTVNTASRMESAGAVGEVNISAATHALVRDRFLCEPRGRIEAKGKGAVEMFFVRAMRPSIATDTLDTADRTAAHDA